MSIVEREPLMRIAWTDPVTGKRGYLVIHTLVAGLATGGTRMRAGCTMTEVEDLARGMALKTAVFGLPVGGAKGGIDCDPKDPEARGVLRRFLTAVRPFLDAHWVTAEDLGVPQHLIDSVFVEIGLGQSYHAAISRSADPAATLSRVHSALNSPVPGGFVLGDVVGGYGVAQACRGIMNARGWEPSETTIAVQGVGTMGGGAAWYLHEAGCRVVAVADAAGALMDPDGLDIPALLELRNAFGEIDRSRVPAHVQRLPREAVLGVAADILIPAATSYAIDPDNSGMINAKFVVEAANTATLPAAEAMLAARGIPVIPDFVANAGAVAWAWWLLLGRVDADPVLSFSTMNQEMSSKIPLLLEAWDTDGVPPRHTALALADRNTVECSLAESEGRLLVAIP